MSTTEIYSIEYKMACLEHNNKKQEKKYSKLKGQLTLQTNLQIGYSNTIRALGHTMFEDQEVKKISIFHLIVNLLSSARARNPVTNSLPSATTKTTVTIKQKVCV